MESSSFINSSLLFSIALNKSAKDADNITNLLLQESTGSPLSIESTEYILRKYSYPIICILGFIGNTMSAVVFLNHSLRRFSCSVFLATRSITDNGVLFSLFMAWLDFIQVRIFHVQVICQLTVFLTYICSFLSVWCVVCVTLDNYIRMCHPSVVKRFCKTRYAVVILVIMIIISLSIYHIPLWTTNVMPYMGKYYCMTMIKYSKIQYILTYIDTALTFVIPFSAILICMCLLICKAVSAHHQTTSNRERYNMSSWPSSTNHYLKVTKLLFAVSVIFLMLHTPIHVIKVKVVIETFSGKLQQPSRMLKTLDYIFQVLYALNFAVNFLVYYSFGKNFRHVYMKTFVKIKKLKFFSNDSKIMSDNLTSDRHETMTSTTNILESETMI